MLVRRISHISDDYIDCLADYLCQWSKELAAPVFSVDYSLAPEDPYPRAVMEVSTM